MRYKVQFTPEAREHLDELEGYIADAGSPVVAAGYVDSIVTYCESLEMFPHRGTMREDLMAGLRITNYRRSTVIAFLADTPTATVSIIGVFYGGQDYEADFLGDEQ